MKTQNAAEKEALFKALRQAMKANGFTYAMLARGLGVSEVTVKRIFASRACALERLMRVCDAIGISFLDLAAMAKEEEEVDTFLSPAQEAYFAERPAHFAILKDLVHGTPLDEIARHWGVTRARLFRVLRALEKLGLIEVHAGERVRIKAAGNIRMTHRGPLARKILRPQVTAFLDHLDRDLENDEVCMHSAEAYLSGPHVEEFVEEIHALGAKYRARAFRDRSLLPRDRLRSVRWLFGFAPYKTDWRSYPV